MKKVKIIFLVVFLLSSVSCASVMTSTMNQLYPGQSMEEVKALLGEPDLTGVHGNDQVCLKYNTFKFFHGVIPYYVIFNRDSNGGMRLVHSGPNMEEYVAKQQAMMDAAQNIQKQNDAVQERNNMRAVEERQFLMENHQNAMENFQREQSKRMIRHPDGTYGVGSGSYMRPDGTYGSTPNYKMAPDGSYVDIH